MAQIRARIWMDDAALPERELAELEARPSTGLCLSGGGTRATCAAIGYLRGLLELGLLDRLRYTSAVSGGSWASVPYSYWRSGAASDAELLGPILAPESLDRATLEAPMPDAYLGAAATRSFRDSLFDDLRGEGPGRAWISAAGETFLEPWGLYAADAPRSYTWSEATRDAILERQAALPGGSSLGVDDFVCARRGRPYPIVTATALGPAIGDNLARLDPMAFEFTPLYAGVRVGREHGYAYKRGGELRRLVGGGVVEPIALGGAGPGYLGDAARQDVTLERGERLSDLAFAIGASSCAYGSVMTESVPTLGSGHGRVPQARYWPVRRGDVPTSVDWEFGDGGTIDNFGLFALLQREVETIIVLVNTKQKLSVGWNPGEGSYQPHIDPYLPPLFGVHEDRAAIALQRNQVFPREEFDGFVAALQAAKLDEGPTIVVCEHRVVDNAWWGIRGDRSVRICWVYLDRVPRFEARLPRATAAAIELGNKRVASGPLQKFPNYETIGANRFSLVRFTPGQVRLLANLCAWTVLDQRALFESLLLG